jgi:hypothetical protein
MEKKELVVREDILGSNKKIAAEIRNKVQPSARRDRARPPCSNGSPTP